MALTGPLQHCRARSRPGAAGCWPRCRRSSVAGRLAAQGAPPAGEDEGETPTGHPLPWGPAGLGGGGDSQAVVFTRLDLGSHRSPAPAPPRRPSSPPSSRGTMPLLRPVSPTGWQLSPLHIPRSGAKTSEASWLEGATGDPERPEAGQGMEGKKRRQSGSARRAQDRAMPEAPSQRANRSQTPPRSSAPGSCALLLSHTSRLPANSATIL